MKNKIYINSQNLKDYILKNMKGKKFMKKKEETKNKINGNIKTYDRISIIRLAKTIPVMNILAKINQKTITKTEHEREKKIIIKEKKISIKIENEKNMEEMKLYFTDLRRNIKYKIYKKFSLIIYLSMPSIKYTFIIKEIKNLQIPYIIQNNLCPNL